MKRDPLPAAQHAYHALELPGHIRSKRPPRDMRLSFMAKDQHRPYGRIYHAADDQPAEAHHEPSADHGAHDKEGTTLTTPPLAQPSVHHSLPNRISAVVVMHDLACETANRSPSEQLHTNVTMARTPKTALSIHHPLFFENRSLIVMRRTLPRFRRPRTLDVDRPATPKERTR